MTKNKDAEFVKGIGYVMALLRNVWKEDSLVEYIFNESGIRKKEFKKYCEGSDYASIKHLLEDE